MIIWNRRRSERDEHARHAMHCTSLCCAKSGESVCVTSLCGCEDAAAKLRDLGVREGARLTVVRDGDPLLVKLDGTRFGIGRAAAINVLCELVESPTSASLPPRMATKASV